MNTEMSITQNPASQARPLALKPALGQGAVIVVALTMLMALVFSNSIVGMLRQNSQRTVVTRQSLQSYYVAQAGVQEALATRMVPRSNTLNFMTTGIPAWKIKPYHSYSGLVYQDPANQKGLIGVYRYLVVGGDPSRKADGSYYGNGDMTTTPNSPKPRLLSFQTSPTASPFYIISSGVTCRRKGGQVAPDQLTGSPTTNANTIGLDPTCKTGFERDEVAVVSRVNVEAEVPSVDRLNRTLVFKRRNLTTPVVDKRLMVTLPSRAFIPGTGGGWTDTVDFDKAWNHTDTTNSPVKPTKIVFFDFATYGIYNNTNLSGNAANAGNVPAKSSIMLYFDGPIDYRSISTNITANAFVYNPNLDGCKLSKAGNLNNCAIQLKDMSTGTLSSGMLIVPILPYLTKVLLLAPLGGSMTVGRQYQLIIRQDYMSSFSGSSNTAPNTPYVVTFTAN